MATLKLMVGELDAESVLLLTELLRYEGTGILAMANEYLEDGPNDEAKAEISRLLARLEYSNEQLEAMAGIVVAGAGQSGLNAASEKVYDCQEFFKPHKIPPGVDKCLEHKESFSLNYLYSGTYRVFYPAASLPAAGWKTKNTTISHLQRWKRLSLLSTIYSMTE